MKVSQILILAELSEKTFLSKTLKGDRAKDFNYLRSHSLITDQDAITEEGTKILTACCATASATASATLGEYYPENQYEYSSINDPRW